jgi:hypothetical protein
MRDMRTWAIAILLVATGCSSSSGGETSQGTQPTQTPTPTSTASGFHVAGDYDTAVRLERSTCKGITVAPNPTTVVHDPGSTRLTLTHAGQTYTGPVTRRGRFTMEPKSIRVGSSVHTLSIVGQFSVTGFQARVTAHVTPEGCEYVVIWDGSKNGPPANVLG